MPRFTSPRPLMLLALAQLLASGAWAQTSEFVALHPCAITGVKSKAQLEELQTLCATEIARGDFQLVPSTQVREFLAKELKGSSCARSKNPKGRLECLGRLATATQAARAVLISVEPGPLTRVSGMVVNASGELVDQKSIQLRNRGQPQEETVRTALMRLREQLSIAPVRLAPLVAEPEPTPAPAPSEPPPPLARAEPPAPEADRQALSALLAAPPRTARTWKTPVAYAAAGTGVVAAGLAVFFGVQSNVAANRFTTLYDNAERPEGSQHPLPTEALVNELQGLRQQVGTQRTLAGVSAGVGAALLGAGAALWFIDRPESSPEAPGATSLSVGPGGVSLRVRLP